MQKNLKNDLDTKYHDIFRNLNIQYKKQLISKYQELHSKGLNNSGVGTKAMYSLIEKLINNTIDELKKLFNELPQKYNRKISVNEIRQYKEKTLKNVENSIIFMDKDLKEEYNDKLPFLSQIGENHIRNLIANSKNNIEKMFFEIENLRKGKKVENLIIFNIVSTILGILIGIASLIVGIIAIK